MQSRKIHLKSVNLFSFLRNTFWLADLLARDLKAVYRIILPHLVDNKQGREPNFKSDNEQLIKNYNLSSSYEIEPITQLNAINCSPGGIACP